MMKGFLLIDKESGVTSFDVVKTVRRILSEKAGAKVKVGHSGTLDPLATGLLLIAVGEGTKLLEYIIGFDKEYEVLAKFGEISDSYDADGEIAAGGEGNFSQKEVEKAIKQNFLGKIQQLPPKYSALKINGKRACDRVRAGEEVEMEPREVRIDSFEVTEFNWPEVRFVVRCGSGT